LSPGLEREEAFGGKGVTRKMSAICVWEKLNTGITYRKMIVKHRNITCSN